MLTRLGVRGFRRIENADVPLGPLNVLIGANGSGKTSFLDVVKLLSRSARRELRAAIADLGGLTSLLTIDHSDRLIIATSITDANYQLTLRPSGIAYEILWERLTVHDKALLTTDHPDPSDQETDLSSVREDLHPEATVYRRGLEQCVHYHTLNVESRSPVRLPQQLRPATLPGPNGEDLVSCLFTLRESHRDRFESIQEVLQVAFPGFDRLDFPPVAAGTLAFTWRDTRFSRPLYAHELSEGMLRFLWITTLLKSPDLPRITLLDEPEVSLHPELLRILVAILREASQRSQILVATHSDRLVRALKPEEVVVCDLLENGLAQITPASQLNLDAWLADYSLDELWQMGESEADPFEDRTDR